MTRVMTLGGIGALLVAGGIYLLVKRELPPMFGQGDDAPTIDAAAARTWGILFVLVGLSILGLFVWNGTF